MLKAESLTADALARRFGMSKVGILRHLHAAAHAGLVESNERPAPRGRPAKVWTLTPAATALFPDAHAELAVSLLECAERAFGAPALSHLLAERSRMQLGRYREALARERTFRGRVESLAAARSTEGYMAVVEWLKHDTAIFVERHCPICAAAKACAGFCADELSVFRRVLPEAAIERTEHLLSGARRCAYRIQKLRQPK